MVIICKRFEIIKSYIIILSIDCNAYIYLHTLNKNQKILNAIIIGENKGAGHQVGEKSSFLARQKFLVDGVAEDSKIWPYEKNYLVWPESFNDFFI